jgi:hypothetical protein
MDQDENGEMPDQEEILRRVREAMGERGEGHDEL